MAQRPGGVAAWLAGFRRSEDGSMVIFSMFLVLVMLMVGGMAVDLMRYESTRARLQATLDSAILAAADLDQVRDAEEVVIDRFDKADLLDELTLVEVTETINSREVEARAEMELRTYFMRLLGYDRLDAPASGVAIESVSDIEIMLVLDVSGSMGNNSRLTNLQTAATEFVTTVLANDAENRISIGIVPFNGQVNLGATLRARYTVTDLHGVADANCVDLPAAAYATSDLSTSLAMPQTAHVDSFSNTTLSNAYYAIGDNLPVATNRWCPPSTVNTVRLPTRNQTTLTNHINAMTAIGATSINAGMRWGLELLDPGSRGMFNALISAGAIPTIFSGRPFDWDRDDTLKVIVLMTDGEHFAEERVNAGFRSGTSPIWRSTTGDGMMSIFHASRVDNTSATTVCNSRPFWVPHRSQWQSRPWNGTSPTSTACYNPTGTTSGTAQMTWPQVWSAVRMKWVAWQMYARPLSSTSTGRTNIYNAQMDAFRTLTPTGDMDTQLQAMCQMARNNEITIFGIAFEAPENGQTQIAGCASSPSHYFNAQGMQIQTAFRAIAAQINQLRLVQ